MTGTQLFISYGDLTVLNPGFLICRMESTTYICHEVLEINMQNS